VEIVHQSGDILNDRYRIVTSLARGGTGTTYEAEDLTHYKRVAVKVVSLRQLTDWKVLELFEREANVLKTLNHPAIPRYLDSFDIDTDADRCFYLVQELIEGDSLALMIQKGWQPGEVKIRQIAAQLLEILCYLHGLKPPAIHRDIKPENILQRPDGQIFLVDFGAVQDLYRQTMTHSGTVVGTFGYMPPEQFRGQAKPASDLYGIGATLVFLLTRQSPDQLPQKRMKIDFRSQVQISEPLARWLDKMLEPAVEDRFQSAAEALDALHGQPSTARSTITLYPKPARSRIILQKRDDRTLSLKIPPRRWGTQALLVLLLNLLWDVPLTVLSVVFSVLGILALAGNSLISGSISTSLLLLCLFIFLCFSAGWFGSLKLFAWLRAVKGYRIDLEIDPYQFRIQQKNFLGLKRHILGKTAAINQIEASSQPFEQANEPTIVSWVLVEGSRKHKFTASIAPSEREWLLAELSNFLAKVQS